MADEHAEQFETHEDHDLSDEADIVSENSEEAGGEDATQSQMPTAKGKGRAAANYKGKKLRRSDGIQLNDVIRDELRNANLLGKSFAEKGIKDRIRPLMERIKKDTSMAVHETDEQLYDRVKRVNRRAKEYKAKLSDTTGAETGSTPGQDHGHTAYDQKRELGRNQRENIIDKRIKASSAPSPYAEASTTTPKPDASASFPNNAGSVPSPKNSAFTASQNVGASTASRVVRGSTTTRHPRTGPFSTASSVTSPAIVPGVAAPTTTSDTAAPTDASNNNPSMYSSKVAEMLRLESRERDIIQKVKENKQGIASLRSQSLVLLEERVNFVTPRKEALWLSVLTAEEKRQYLEAMYDSIEEI